MHVLSKLPTTRTIGSGSCYLAGVIYYCTPSCPVRFPSTRMLIPGTPATLQVFVFVVFYRGGRPSVTLNLRAFQSTVLGWLKRMLPLLYKTVGKWLAVSSQLKQAVIHVYSHVNILTHWYLFVNHLLPFISLWNYDLRQSRIGFGW